MHIIFLIVISVSFISLSYGTIIIEESVAAKEGILLTLANSSFSPLSTAHGNQISVSVKYQINDQSLENENLNGIMKLYSTNGSLIHSSSFPGGFIVKKKGGSEDFKTTIKDPTIQSLIANVTFTDLKKTETLSNVVTAKLQLKSAGAESLVH
ncbi:MAG TPA: hypothetical protein VF884_09160 [Nitrososphaeraceae archaeon]